MRCLKKTAFILGGMLVLFFAKPRVVLAVDVMIVAPIGTTASTYYSVSYAPQWMIDGSGLTGTGRDATHMNANSANLFWHSNTGIVVSNQWVEFDLGQTYDITNALIWQLAQSGFITRGVKAFTISVATPDHNFITLSANNVLNIATGLANEPVQSVPLMATNVRYVRFSIESNWGASGIVGLSEVRFEVAPPAPSTDLVLAPAGATASSYYTAGYAPQWMIDGSGLTGTGRQAVHTNLNAENLFWHSYTGIVVSTQWVEFDLGAPYDVANALVWQLAQSNMTARGVKAFSVKVAGIDHLFSTDSISNVLGIASAQPVTPVQVVSLAAKNIRYIRFDIHSNWGATEGIAGLSEVRFEVAPPETNAVFRTWVTNAVSSFYPLNPKKYMIDGSGLTGTGLAATHTNGLGQTSMWLSAVGLVTNEWVEFDFGWEIDLVSTAIWQYNQNQNSDLSPNASLLNRGVKSMTIYTAGNGKSYKEYGKVSLAKGQGTVEEPVQIMRLKSEGVRYVKFAVNKNWGDGNMVGLSEVQFLYTKRLGTLVALR